MDVVYFELNNWFSGRDYPPDGNLSTWVESNQFNDDKWCKENRLCVYSGIIDMSENWCITAPKDWVLENCPELLEGKPYTYTVYVYSCGRNSEEQHTADYSDFLRYKDEFGDVWGRFGWPFLEYAEENFGSHYYADDYYEEDEDDEE